MNLYQYNSKTLEFEKVSLRRILILPLILIVGITFNFLYFRAEIINDWEWKYERNEPLRKVETKITIEEWMEQK